MPTEHDSMGERLDETRDALDKLRGSVTTRRDFYSLNPHAVIDIFPRVCSILEHMHDTMVVLDHRLNQLEEEKNR